MCYPSLAGKISRESSGNYSFALPTSQSDEVARPHAEISEIRVHGPNFASSHMLTAVKV